LHALQKIGKSDKKRRQIRLQFVTVSKMQQINTLKNVLFAALFQL